MADSLTWQFIGVQVATEGIKFLFTQAGEALKQWREKKKDAAKPSEVASDTEVPETFEAKGIKPTIYLNAVEKLLT